MKYPFCRRLLRPGKLQYFETLSEHVCDPNGEDGDCGLRPTWECTCEIAKNAEAYWNEDGELYIGNYRNYKSHVVMYDSAIDSRTRRIDITMNLSKLRWL